MREPVDAAKVRRFMEVLGRRSTGPGRVYLTGGGTAVLVGWRSSTVDLDLKFAPEPSGAFEALARIKDELSINVEIASPDDFIPELPGWRERSPHIARHGSVDFYHYDFYAQTLAKIERGHSRDLDDVRRMLERGFVVAEKVRCLFDEIAPRLHRYPAVDPDIFRAKLDAALPSGPGEST